MKSRPATVIMWLSLLLVLLLSPQAQSSPLNDPALKDPATVTKNSGHDQIDVIVWLKDSPAQKPLGHGKLSRAHNEKILQNASAASQKDILSRLAKLKKNKQISSFNSFWLINAIHVKGTKAALKEISKTGNIEKITPNSEFKVPPVERSYLKTLASPSEWGIDKIRADKAQDDLGIDGSGVVIGHIDTGYDPDHPDLAGKLAGWAEFDENGDQVPGSTPHDSDTHGTHTAGTLVGGDAGGTRIGVAPGATVLSALALPEGWATYSQVIGAMEWVADPDLDPQTDDGAKVVSMSFGGDGTDNDIADAILNMLALDAVPVASIGNCGENCTGNPGNVPGAVGVGATDVTDTVADFSSGGVVSWNYPPYVGDFVKPDVSAPGVDVLSSVPGGDYDTYSGTSMAAPHAAGAIALMRQADASMDAEEIKLFNHLSVVDLGDEGKDTRYGHGRVDSYVGVSNVLNAATLSGIIQGDDNGSIAPIQANVKFLDVDIVKKSDPATGAYSVRLPAGTYDVRFSAFGYVTQTSQVVLVPETTTTLDVVLDLAPIRALEGTVFAADTGDPLLATADLEFGIEDEPSVVQTSTQTDPATGRYSLSIPEGSYDLKVDAVGYDALNTVFSINSDATADFTLEKAPDILLVNGSWNSDSAYTLVLDDLEVSYRSINRSETTVNSDILEDYSDVVWFTGYNFIDPVTEPEQSALASYMDGGGNLFITGQDIGFNLVEWEMGETFYKNYLHAEYISDWSAYENLYGAPGSIHEGTEITAYSWIADTIMPATTDASGDIDSSAIDSLIFGSPETDEIKYDGAIEASTDTNKLVYYSFGFEDVDSSYAREVLMRKVLNYFGYGLPVPVLQYGPQGFDLKSKINTKFSKRLRIGNTGSGDLRYELSPSYCKADWNDQALDETFSGEQRDDFLKKYEKISERAVAINDTDPTNLNGSELVLKDADEKDIAFDLKSLSVRSDKDNIGFRLTGYTDLLGGSDDVVEIGIPIDEDRDRTTGFWGDGVDKVVVISAIDGEISDAYVYSSSNFFYDLLDSTSYSESTKTLSVHMPVCVINNFTEMNYFVYVYDYMQDKTDYAPDDTYFNAFSIHPDWLSLGVYDGEAPELSSDLVKLKFNTAEMSPGRYDATIYIKNNADIESIVPIDLRVTR